MPQDRREVGEELAMVATNLLLMASLERCLSQEDDRRRALQVMNFTFKVC